VPVPEPEKKGEEGATPPESSPEGQKPTQGEPAADLNEVGPELRKMAEDLFARAAQATQRNNFGYAIHLYMDGLRYNPRDVENGHKGLRECALRKSTAGKGGGLGSLFSQVKGAVSQMLGRQKDAMMGLLEALADDPQNITLLMQVMQTARRQDYHEVAIFYGEVAAEETLRSKKPQKQIFTTLADLYESRKEFKKAVEALGTAIKIDPSDRDLDRQARNLAAQASIEEGGLENVSDFRQMVKDKAQASQSAQQQVVRTKEQLDAQYEDLKTRLEADPANPVKMQQLADCQWRRGFLDEALALLQQALDTSKDYRFKSRMDDIRMAEIRRAVREIDEQLEADPNRTDLKAKRAEAVTQRDRYELDVYNERVRQYPTEMGIRYELGVRQYRIGTHDEAIGSLQMATRDPKRRVQALSWLGKCFYAKKLLQEAQSQFETAIQQYELSSDPLGKELRYNLAKCFEAQNKLPQAIEWYSVIVQQDYQYRDAAKRLEALRRKVSEGEAQA
jgi:tetratricopeptide (TPR) repeat protein